jgi:hypothetical protein
MPVISGATAVTLDRSAFIRDAAGLLTRIEAGTQWIAFTYGDGGRIARADNHLR